MCQGFDLFVCLKDSIKDLLRHVLRSVQPIMADVETVVHSAGATERFFELVGADIVLDSDLQPFLCEVHTVELTSGALTSLTVVSLIVYPTIPHFTTRRAA